jgi:hypothetical protein
MTEYSRHLSANSYRLTGGDLTVGQGMGQTTQGHHGRGAVSVTARVLDLDVTLANWEGRGAAADSTLPLTTFPLPLDALPASVQVWIQAMPAPTCVDSAWFAMAWLEPTTSRYPSRRRSRTTTSTESTRRRPLTTLRQERTDDDPNGPQ